MSILVWDYKKNIIRNENYGTYSLFSKDNALMGIVTGTAVHELYASEDNAEAQFKSGWLGEGGLIQDKVQDECYIAYKGDLSFMLYVEETLVLTKELSSATVAIEKFKFPVATTRNNFVEVEFLGSGEVYEVNIPQENANG